MKLKLPLLLTLLVSISALSQVPSYYNDINITLTGTALKTELATKIINTHTTSLSYTPGVWNALKQTDLDPNDNTKVILLYGSNDGDGNYITDRTRGKDLNGGTAGTQWNREHTFPKSLGNPNLGTSGPGSDAHHLRACDITLNQNRGSLLFIDGSGVAGSVGSGFYPGDEWKGDVARMVMYMYLRYGSRCNPNQVAIGTTNSTDANMIDLLLEWNAEDPVSDYETQRNTALESLQGNRNPFIDNPAFATTIWGGVQAETKFNSASDCSELFISEYIEGAGNNKFLEIYNPSGSSINLANYDLVTYQNGSTSIAATLTLSGTIASGGTFVIEHSSENTGFGSADLSTSNTVMTFNGDDVIALRKSSTIIDVIGQIGTDPGSQWSGGSCNLGTADAVLRRNSSIKTGDTNSSDAFNPGTEWTCSAVPDTSNLGSHTSLCLTNEIDIQGNNVSIVDGSTATSLGNDTNFGSITTSSGSIIKTFTILNQGSQTLTLSGNPVISGTNSADFSLSVNPTLAINGVSSTTFSISFDPSADGTRTATITVNSNDADEGVYTFNIEGTGTADSGGGNCGSETFTNSNAPTGTYSDGSFTGDNSVTWTYVRARDDQGFEITGKGLMLDNTSSKITSSTVSGGIGDFSMKLKKGFTGSGNRQVQLYVNNVLKGTSVSWDNTTTQDFTVSGINVSGNVVIEIRNNTGKQVILDDISWTCYQTTEIDIQGNNVSIPDGTTATSTSNNTDFGSINTASGSITKRFTILNTGGQTLTLSGDPLVAISGTNASDFSLTSVPSSSIANSSSTTFDITFNPSADGDRTATLTVNSNDDDEATYNFNIKGTGTSGVQTCASVSGATIFQQDFESSPATPTLTYTSSNTTTSSGNGNTPSDPMYSGGTQGLKNSSGTASVVFNSVDVSSYTNVAFSIRLASFSGTTGNGAEITDYVKVSISTDDGSTYSDELTVTGASSGANARWSFTSGTGIATTAYDGNNTTTSFAPSGGDARTTDGYSTLNITGIPSSSNLKIKIDLKNGGGNEIWVIDDAKITADSESTTTWNGTTWSDGTPNATTKVILDGNYNMATSPSINSCECEIKSGKTLTISEGKFLTIEGNLINNGSIIIDSEGSLIQVSSSATATGSGLYSVNRKSSSLPSKNVFTYWSSPLTNSTLNEVVSGAGKYYSFIPVSQSWNPETSATSMTPGIGYVTQGDPGISYPSFYTAAFTGSTLNTGTINVAITKNNDANNDNDWNLIGNPYASAINADAFLAANSSVIGGTLYFWTHNTDASTSQNFSQNDYVSWNGTGGIAGCSGCTAPTNFIPTGQGFFAQGLNSTNATFTNAMRISGENTNFYREEIKPKDKLWLNFFNEESFSQILIGFMNDATDDVDNKYDGLRLDSGANACFYSIIEDNPYAIQGKSNLKEVEEIPLGITLKVTGQFTISIDHLEGKLEHTKVILVDKLLNTEHDLKASNYTFTIDEKGKYDNRFILRTETPNSILDVLDVTPKTDLLIVNSNSQIEIKTSNNKLIKDVFIYDLLGREITKKANNKSPRVIITSKNNFNHHIMIIKVILESGEIVTKKIIK